MPWSTATACQACLLPLARVGPECGIDEEDEADDSRQEAECGVNGRDRENGVARLGVRRRPLRGLCFDSPLAAHAYRFGIDLDLDERPRRARGSAPPLSVPAPPSTTSLRPSPLDPEVDRYLGPHGPCRFHDRLVDDVVTTEAPDDVVAAEPADQRQAPAVPQQGSGYPGPADHEVLADGCRRRASPPGGMVHAREVTCWCSRLWRCPRDGLPQLGARSAAWRAIGQVGRSKPEPGRAP